MNSGADLDCKKADGMSVDDLADAGDNYRVQFQVKAEREWRKSHPDAWRLLTAAAMGDTATLRAAGPAAATAADDRSGWTTLHAAASRGHVECVQLLVAEGACVDAVDHNGRSPVAAAAEFATSPYARDREEGVRAAACVLSMLFQKIEVDAALLSQPVPRSSFETPMHYGSAAPLVVARTGVDLEQVLLTKFKGGATGEKEVIQEHLRDSTAWHAMVVVPAFASVCRSAVKNKPMLIDAVDKFGRAAIAIAKTECRESSECASSNSYLIPRMRVTYLTFSFVLAIVAHGLFFLGRFSLSRPLHRSKTCAVISATDVRLACCVLSYIKRLETPILYSVAILIIYRCLKTDKMDGRLC